jgi:hypothetical protein
VVSSISTIRFPGSRPLVNRSILLINPPVAKPCEPPAGLAQLHRVLTSAGVDCRVLDASLHGILDLLVQPLAAGDTWSRRAVGQLPRHLADLRLPHLYTHTDRYKRAVMDVNRVLAMHGRQSGTAISLSNFSDPLRSPVRRADLIAAAEQCDANPFVAVLEERLERMLTDWTPGIVGISIGFMSQVFSGFALAGWVRRRLPGVRIVMGGGLVTSWGRIPGMGNPFRPLVDDLIVGPGEGALLAMCGASASPPSPGCGGDYADFPLDRYLSPGLILPVSASRGCYWQKCAFCPERTEAGGYHPQNPDGVSRHLEAAARLSPHLIHFLDNALSPRFLNHLTRRPPGAPWYGFARITPHLADPGFAAALQASGCVMLKLGIESGDQAVLDALGKGIALATVSRVLRTLKAAGIATYAYLLFGTPVETEAAARKTLTFVLDHAEAIDFLNLAVFNLPAHSPEAARLDTGSFYPGDLSLYRDFIHPSGWHRDRVRRFVQQEFKKPPAIRAILAKDPPFFTSNHAPFFTAALGIPDSGPGAPDRPF